MMMYDENDKHFDEMSENLTDQSWIETGFIPEYLRIENDGSAFNLLWDMKPGFRHKCNIYGKQIDMPREQQVYGSVEYLFSGAKLKPKPIPVFLQKYLDWANEHDNTQDKYNMILVNWYHNGHDYIGWHKDNEPEIIPDSNIMTISFGEMRKFKIKHDTNKSKKRDIPTASNGYIIMGGEFQKEFKHCIGKTQNPFLQGKRISLTFRKFIINT